MLARCHTEAHWERKKGRMNQGNMRLDTNKSKHLIKQNQLLMQYHEIDPELDESQM